jgi:opacity protein-like surface antigen
VPRGLLVLTLFFASLTPAPVSADWLVAPFAGVKFGGAICPGMACPGVNDFVDPEDATGLRKFTFGGAFGLLTDGVLGLQAEFAYIPGYFDRGGVQSNLVVESSAMTLTGDVLLAVPATITRDGLRPYLVVGAGLIRWSRRNPDDVFNVSTNQFAIAVGGGALGRLTDRTSARFELRRVVGRDDEALRYGLSLWRATVGIAIRY